MLQKDHGSCVASHGSLDVSQGSSVASQECFFHRFLQFIHYYLFWFLHSYQGLSIVLSVALIVYTSPHGSSIPIRVYPLSHLLLL
jgi:hypothetical protein